MTPDVDRGAVLGIDVGFSRKRRSTGFCLLTWDEQSVTIRLQRTTCDPEERRGALLGLLTPDLAPLTVAIDGPLTRGLELVEHYRVADALFSQGVFQKRGKAGQTSSPVGQLLHQHATMLARLVLEVSAEGRCRLACAEHCQPIHTAAIVEAFPNQFLGALLAEVDLPMLRRNASDRYWEACLTPPRLLNLISHLLPGRATDGSLTGLKNHDDRAAIVCALTALSVSAGEAVGAGDPVGGDIMLPPPSLWADSLGSPRPWMAVALEASLAATRRSRPEGHSARLTYHGHPWSPP